MSPEPNGKSANYGCSADNLVSIINTSHSLVRGRSSWQTSEGLEQETNPCMDGGLLKLCTYQYYAPLPPVRADGGQHRSFDQRRLPL